MTELKAAISALRVDAARWKEVASTLGSAQGAVNGLSLGVGPLSWASTDTGLVDTYAEIQAKVHRLLGEGKTNLDLLGQALEKVAKAYEKSDEDAARRLKGVWDLRE